MAGTVIITGANGTLALQFVDQLVSLPSAYGALVAAVRNPSLEDTNTAKLAKIISAHDGARAFIEPLDLATLSGVRSFADDVARRIAKRELPPISAIVCNAFSWSLNGQSFTPDGYETTFQVCHLGHYLLVLKLLGSMAPDGRIVFLGSNAHYPDRPNPHTKLIAKFPDSIEWLVKPKADEPGTEHDRGFQRYGSAKLASVMFMNDLNSRLQKNPKLSNISVTATDPIGIIDSRAHRSHGAGLRLALSVARVLLPVLKYISSTIRPTSELATDLLDVSTGESFKGVRGYFLGVKPSEPAELSRDAAKQAILWDACWKWAGMHEGDCVIY